jgi:hypothetical protein
MIPIWLFNYMRHARSVKNNFNGIKVVLKKDNKVVHEDIFQVISGDTIVLDIDSIFQAKDDE